MLKTLLVETAIVLEKSTVTIPVVKLVAEVGKDTTMIEATPQITIGIDTTQIDNTNVTTDTIEDQSKDFGRNVANLVSYTSSENEEEEQEKKKKEVEKKKKKEEQEVKKEEEERRRRQEDKIG